MSIDDHVPEYRILSRLGSGAGSALYKARSRKTGEIYTVKYVKLHSPDDSRFIDQMKTEHACGSVVDHPAVRKTFSFHYIRRLFRLKSAALFMEFVDGTTLPSLADRIPVGELIRIMEKVSLGLQAMHEGGFVHADVKPQNILVLPDRSVKLIDFGQAAAMHRSKSRVQGTIDYIAPEQVDLQPLSARTDVFGFGATLHRLLTGKPVPTELNQNININSGAVTGVRIKAVAEPTLDGLPKVIAKLITDCCQPAPRDRPTDMKEVLDRCRLARKVLSRK
ncbi:MAG TPA: serine/threonine-protein kinase [Phycisphaerae bacterium]|nr:serine/threonine-protein kinase [Phycisphaerae bacterium]